MNDDGPTPILPDFETLPERFRRARMQPMGDMALMVAVLAAGIQLPRLCQIALMRFSPTFGLPATLFAMAAALLLVQQSARAVGRTWRRSSREGEVLDPLMQRELLLRFAAVAVVTGLAGLVLRMGLISGGMGRGLARDISLVVGNLPGGWYALAMIAAMLGPSGGRRAKAGRKLAETL